MAILLIGKVWKGESKSHISKNSGSVGQTPQTTFQHAMQGSLLVLMCLPVWCIAKDYITTALIVGVAGMITNTQREQPVNLCLTSHLNMYIIFAERDVTM